MLIELGIGNRRQSLQIQDSRVVGIARQKQFVSDLPPEQLLNLALDEPVGSAKVEDIINPGEKVVVITSDVTRPCPSREILPPLLKRLELSGCSKSDITIVFALGNHRPHTEEEKRKLVGDNIFENYKCVDTNSKDVINMGSTPKGTPVDITRVVAEADRRICIGNIEYHYFAGYSGGAKAIMPGSSTWEAIQANHSKMVDPNACAGNIIGNPVRDDLEEAIKFCNIDFILNVVLDEKKNIIHAVSGHYIDAHRVGCKFLDKVNAVELREKADIVVVSQGGAPKDLNLYQTQKALDNSKYAVKDGGIIILVGSCIEGLGEEVFSDWMLNAKSPGELITRLYKDFKLGGHKAAAIAMVMEKAEIFMVSDMDDELVSNIFMTPFNDVQKALDVATKKLGNDSTVYIMPYGGSTLPLLKADK